MKELVTRTTCDICHCTQQVSDRMPDIEFGFWVEAEGLDVCWVCASAVEGSDGLHKQIIKAVKNERKRRGMVSDATK